MKTLAELAEIRDRMKDKIALRHGMNDIRIVVGMGTCGISAGARDVLNAFVEEVTANGLLGSVTVTQSGCMGDCGSEPVVRVEMPGKEDVVYVDMTPEKAKKVVLSHIVGGTPASEYMKK